MADEENNDTSAREHGDENGPQNGGHYIQLIAKYLLFTDSEAVLPIPENTREWAEKVNYDPDLLFKKLFHDDIQYLLKMENLWKERRKPTPFTIEDIQNMGCSSAAHNDIDGDIKQVRICIFLLQLNSSCRCGLLLNVLRYLPIVFWHYVIGKQICHKETSWYGIKMMIKPCILSLPVPTLEP